jgi:hypothetical protein
MLKGRRCQILFRRDMSEYFCSLTNPLSLTVKEALTSGSSTLRMLEALSFQTCLLEVPLVVGMASISPR